MGNIIAFGILAMVILCAAIYSISTKYIMRSATALLFVLCAVAGLYFVLDYTFLGAVQLSIYAGAITMIYIFAIQLIDKQTLQGLKERISGSRLVSAAVIGLVSLATIVTILLKNNFLFKGEMMADREVDMHTIGTALMGAGKYQYVLPFEFISLFLLACIIGGLVVARLHEKSDQGAPSDESTNESTNESTK